MLWKAVRGEMRLPGEVGRLPLPQYGVLWAFDKAGFETGDILIALRQEEEKETYQIRNSAGDILAEFGTLLEARIASVGMKESTEIIERKFVDGEWEETIVYQRIITLRPEVEK